MKNAAIQGYCPVTYFLADKPSKGSAQFASIYDGQTYHFVSADAKNAFDMDPAKFAPEFGGSCAFGMSIKENFTIDPTNYKIVNERLFLFMKNDDTDALALWNAGNESELIANADTNFSTE